MKKTTMKHILTVVLLIVTVAVIALFASACSSPAQNSGDANETIGENIMLENAYINSELNDVTDDKAAQAYVIAKYPVVPGRQVVITARMDSFAYCAWVDANGNRTPAMQGKATMNTGRNVSATLNAPETAAYLLISYDASEELTIWQSSYFTNVKIGLLGDSIAENGGFLNVIVSELGISAKKNVAHGGWVYTELNEDATLQKGVFRQVDELVGDETLIILWAGTNDFGRSRPIGKLGDTEADTFYGGIHQVIIRLREKLGEDIPIVICTPLERNRPTDGFSSKDTNPAGYYLKDYADAIRSAAEHYGLIVFDATVTGLDPNDKTIDMQYFDDGLHPNDAGHKIIGDELVKFLKETFE